MLGGYRWVLDGGLASTLQNNGYEIDGHPLWSARLLGTNPSAIQDVHTAFLEAGAEIIITGSYQASIEGFQKYHLAVTSDDALNLISLSVTVAKQAVEKYCKKESKKERKPLIAGSIGPYGACQADGSEYCGSYVTELSEDFLINWHKPRVSSLVTAGVDFLAIETIPSLKEAIAILTLLKEFPNTKAWVTFSCKNAQETNYGDKISTALLRCYEVASDQLIGLGINCTQPQFVTSLLKEANTTLPSFVTLPRVVYPNSGEEWVAGHGWTGHKEAFSYIREVPEWIKLGATVIGGCCRVSPNDIQNIATALSEC